MTDKTKKEKPSYELKITRRATVDTSFNYYEFEATIDPAKINGMKAIQDIEKIVTFAREFTATEAPKQPKEKKPAKKKKAAPEPEPTEETKIAELEEGDKKINLNVRFLKDVGDIKSFTKSDGAKGMLSKISVEDESGDEILLTAWDDQAIAAQKIKKNAWVFLQNAYVTEYKGTLELNVGNWGKMEVKYNG